MYFKRIDISADWHGEILQIQKYCAKQHLTKEYLVLVCGDAGLNFNGYHDDKPAKSIVNSLGPTFLFVRGNHEMRPQTCPYYNEVSWAGGTVYQEAEFPNLLFAKDGEIYKLNDMKCICIGGAYSVDMHYRRWLGELIKKKIWWEDEQLNECEKQYVEQRLKENNWEVDLVLSHTVPYKYLPTESFLEGIDQSTVSQETEKWLDYIESKLKYRKWYAGHFHCSKKIDNLEIVYENYHEITDVT